MAEVARIDFESIERPFITVNLGGEEKQLPITFDDSDLRLVGDYKGEPEKAIKAFFAKYLGDIVYKLGDDQLGHLAQVFTAQREAIGAPELGEA